MNLDPYLISYKNSNSWWRNLNEKTKMIKLLDKMIGEYNLELGVGKDFLRYRK